MRLWRAGNMRSASLLAAFALTVFAWGRAGLAAEVALGRAEAVPGQERVCIPVTLTLQPGEDVSGIQFNLVFRDASVRFEEVIAGPAATEASKSLYANTLSPREVLVLIAGLNQGQIRNGIIAQCYANVAADASPGQHPVALDKLTVSDPYGTRLPSQMAYGAIIVGRGGESVAEEPVGNADYPPAGEAQQPAAGASTVRFLLVGIPVLGLCIAGAFFLRRARRSRSR